MSRFYFKVFYVIGKAMSRELSCMRTGLVVSLMLFLVPKDLSLNFSFFTCIVIFSMPLQSKGELMLLPQHCSPNIH